MMVVLLTEAHAVEGATAGPQVLTKVLTLLIFPDCIAVAVPERFNVPLFGAVFAETVRIGPGSVRMQFVPPPAGRQGPGEPSIPTAQVPRDT